MDRGGTVEVAFWLALTEIKTRMDCASSAGDGATLLNPVALGRRCG
jgi:hypothetical protein